MACPQNNIDNINVDEPFLVSIILANTAGRATTKKCYLYSIAVIDKTNFISVVCTLKILLEKEEKKAKTEV